MALSTPPASAAATVQGVTVVTGQPTYFNVTGLNDVVATANLAFNGNGPLDQVLFQWFPFGSTVPFARRYVPSTGSMSPALAQDSWLADRVGRFNVTATINATLGSPPLLAGSATFAVLDRTVLVDVSDITVRTLSSFYENSRRATARADLTWRGVPAYLGDVRFDWYYPDWSLASTAVFPRAVTGVAWSNWTVNREGAGFHVNATYLPQSNVTKTTSFDVIAPRVSPGGWLPPVLGPGRVILNKSGGPYGVCNNTYIPAGTEVIVASGTQIRFCRDKGLFVNGTIRLDSPPPAERVYFLSYDNITEPGYWRGITFNPSATPDSTLFNAVVRGATEGVIVKTTSITILNTTFEFSSDAAIALEGSASIVVNNTIDGANIGVRISASTGPLLETNQIRGTRVGILAVNSDIRLRSNTISQAAQIGLQAVGTNLTADGDTLRDCGDMGAFLQNVPGARLSSLRITGANDSLRADGSRDVVLERSTLLGARFRALYLTGTTATVVNSTLVSALWDLQLVSSTTTLINSTFSTLYTPVNSTLVVQNFLHVLVESSVSSLPRVPGAWVNVSADGTPVLSRQTNAGGFLSWILLTDRIVDSTHTVEVANLVEVAVPGMSVVSSPKTVDMRTSHLETFVATTILNPDIPRPAIESFLLILLAAALGAALVAMPAVRRWRENGNGNGKAKTPAHQVVLEPGTSYLLADEKPDRAFAIFESQLAKGAKGLIVTRIYPDEVRRRYRLKDVPVLWLSRGYGKQTVNPTNLGAIVQDIERFVSGKEDSVVLFDGMEYLLVQNDPKKVVKFVQTLADTASMHRTKVLIPFNPKSVSEDQAALLTRDLQPL